MSSNRYCFKFNSFIQATEIIKACKKIHKVPVLLVKYHMINGLGIDWLIEFKIMLKKKFKSSDFKIYIETKKNYGLFIGLVEQKINYINIKADKETTIRLRQIAKINKVLINPNFSIVDVSKSKHINNKLKKLYNIKH